MRGDERLIPDEEAPQARKPRVHYTQQMVGLLVAAGVLWLLFGKGSPLAVDRTAPAPAAVAPSPRVAVSSPAISETLWELGLAAHVVGRSPYCTRVPKEVPVVGDLRDFDAERLAIVKPEVLFVQPPLAGVDPALRSLCSDRGIRLVERRIDSFDGTRALVADIADAFATKPAPGAEGLAGRLASAEADFAALAAAVASADDASRAEAPQVLLLVASEPFLAVGRGNYLDELLAACGLGNAVARRGWTELSPEEIVLAGADAILCISEDGRGVERFRTALDALPWEGRARPRAAVRALPQLLSPSLVALRARPEIRALFEASAMDGAAGSRGAGGRASSAASPASSGAEAAEALPR